MGLRFLAVFAFMQTMHYVVWVGVLPRYAPEAAARFDARVPVLRFFAPGTAEISYARLIQTTRYGGAHLLQVGYTLPF